MSELVEVRLQDGRTMFVEVEESPRLVVSVPPSEIVRGDPTERGNPVERGIDGDDVVTRSTPALRAVMDFSDSVQTIKSAAADLLDALSTIEPNSCEISFGVKLSGSFGAVLAKVSTEANFSVKMTWNDLQQRGT